MTEKGRAERTAPLNPRTCWLKNSSQSGMLASRRQQMMPQQLHHHAGLLRLRRPQRRMDRRGAQRLQLVYPLSNFRSWSTSWASVTSGSASGVISSFPDDELTRIDPSGAVKAQPDPSAGAAVSPSPGSAARNRVARVPLARNRVARVPLAGGTGCSGSSRPEAKPLQPVSPPIHGSPVWHRRWSRPLNEASCRTITGICRA